MPTSDLSHQQMHEIVDRGESFLHDGQVVSTKDKIPHPESLAATTTDKHIIASSLDAEIAALQRRRASLDVQGTEVEQQGAIAAQPGRHVYKGGSSEDETPTNGKKGKNGKSASSEPEATDATGETEQDTQDEGELPPPPDPKTLPNAGV